MNAEDLAAILDELGRRLGPTGEYVFRLAVQRVVIDRVMGLVFWGSTVLVAVGGLIATWRWYRASDSYDRGLTAGLIALFAGAGLFFGLFVVFSDVRDLLTAEYTALRDILSAVGGAR